MAFAAFFGAGFLSSQLAIYYYSADVNESVVSWRIAAANKRINVIIERNVVVIDDYCSAHLQYEKLIMK